MELFETIKIREEHKKAFEELAEQINIAQVAFQNSSFLLKKSREKLFEAIEDKFPETKGFELNYDHEAKTITALRKK